MRSVGIRFAHSLKRIAVWFTQYPLYKLVSLLLATSLWLVQRVVYNPIREVMREVPVEVLGLQDDWDILNKPKRVELRLRGPAAKIAHVADGVSARIDVNNLDWGVHEVPIIPPVIPGVQVLAWDPATQIVTLDKLDTKELDITPLVIGTPSPGYECLKQRMSFDPSKVTVTGLRFILRQIRQARVVVNVADRDKKFDERLLVQPVDGEGRPVNNVKVEPSTTVAEVFIQRIKKRKSVPIEAVIKGKPAAGYAFGSLPVLSRNQVTLLGEPDRLKAVDSIKTEPLDVSGKWSPVRDFLDLQIPEGIEVEDGVNQVMVEVDIRPIENPSEASPKHRARGLMVPPGLGKGRAQ